MYIFPEQLDLSYITIFNCLIVYSLIKGFWGVLGPLILIKGETKKAFKFNFLRFSWKDVGFVDGFFLRPGRLTYMRLVVACVVMLDLPFLVVSVGCCLLAILVGLFGEATNNIAWVVRLQTSPVGLVLVGFRTLLGDRLPRLLKKVQNEAFGQNLKLFKLFGYKKICKNVYNV